MITGRQSLRPALRFPARFLALVAGMYAVGSYIEPLRSAITRVVMLGVPAATSAFGVPGEMSADGLTSFADSGFAYVVTFECASVSAIVVLVAAILAYPSTSRHPITMRQRMGASLAGIVGLMLLNYVRLGALAWIGVHAPDQFEAAHVYWFQGLTFLAVALGWLAWVHLVVRRDPAERSAVDAAIGLRRFAARFAGVFAPLTAAGVFLGLDRLYAHLVGLAAFLAAPIVWGAGITRPEVSAVQGAYLFAGLVALLALMLATPRVDRSESLRRFVRVAPLLALGHVVAVVAQIGAAKGLEGPAVGLIEGLLVLPMALVIAPLPLAIWFAWSERHTRRRAPGRDLARSRGADRVRVQASPKG